MGPVVTPIDVVLEHLEAAMLESRKITRVDCDGKPINVTWVFRGEDNLRRLRRRFDCM